MSPLNCCVNWGHPRKMNGRRRTLMWCPNSSVFFLFLRVGGKEGCSEGGRGIDNFRQGTVHHRSARTGNQTSRHTVEFNLLFFLIVPISFATKNASTVDKCVWMIVILTTNPSITLTPQGSKVLGEKVKGPIRACTTYKKRVGEPWLTGCKIFFTLFFFLCKEIPNNYVVSFNLLCTCVFHFF